jgi:hypothetical protein
MRRLWLLGALGVALLFSIVVASSRPAAAQGRSLDPPAVVLAGVAAVNTGDLAAVAALLADDATLEVLPGPAPGGLRLGGREAILAFWRQAVAAGVQARLAGPPRVAGERVTVVVRYTDTALRARGQAVQGTVETTVVAGRAVTVVVREVTPVPLALYEALPAGPAGVGLPRTGAGAGATPLAAAGAAGAALTLTAALTAVLLRRGARRPRQP